MSMRPRKRQYRLAFEQLESRTVLSRTFSSLAALAGLRSTSHTAAVRERAQLNSLVPLTELGPGMYYQGLEGGLYGGGSNQAPLGLLDAALAAAANIVPRNKLGEPSRGGKIGVIAIGQSTTRQWFPYFQGLARQLPPPFVFVNASQDGMISQLWANLSAPWSTADKDVTSYGLSRFQVQVATVDCLRGRSWKDGGLQSQIEAYSADLARIVRVAKAHYPNLQLIYVLPFHYAGFANSRRVTREPFSYQEGFGIRQLILRQGGGLPVLLWGPYVWADTANPSYFYDGIHFTKAGREQMATLTWRFLQKDLVAARWLRSG